MAGYTPAALAQTEQLEEVVVTGSRIVRRDYESNSPIITVDASAFETQTGLNIESYLNQLPTYNPATTPVTSQGDVQITPVNSVGIASISLRGFGPNRSLVLVNGKRPTPINALMVTDVNGVPSALVQRVETITGGASAVYGADAIGGVTNFILRDNYEGFEVDAQYGTSEAGDGDETRISLVLGGNFADGRGNVAMGLEHYDRETAYNKNRDIYTDNWGALDTAGSFIFLQGVNAYSCDSPPRDNVPPGMIANDFTCPQVSAIRALYPEGVDPFAWFVPFSIRPNGTLSTGFNFNPDGSIFLAGNAVAESKYRGVIDGQSYAKMNAINNQDPTGTSVNQVLKWNNTQAWTSAPQERFSFFTSGNFDVTDTVNVFGRATFAESTTNTLLFGTNAISGWEGTVPYDPMRDSPIDPSLDYTNEAVVRAAINNPAAYANPNFIPTGHPDAHFPVPVELAALLNSRADQTARWQPQWNPDFSLPPRQTSNTNEVWQVEMGVNFELPVRDWTGELYFSHGRSATYNVAGGNLSATRYRALLTYPDYGRNASGTGNMFYPDMATGELVPTVRPAFGVGDFTCTSGFYDTFFGGDQPLSEDCFNAINATLQTRTQNQQEIIELNLQGSVMELPAGELRAAVGFQARDNEAQFYPDILQSQDSFTDQVVGVYPTGYLDASTSVKDYYVEALVPVLSGLKGVDLLELELGARYSDYNETDAETTWKALANWQVNDWIRLRGGFNRATRAPNLGELFLNQQEVFTGGGSFSDACGIRSNAPYGAGGTQYATDPIQDPNEPPPFVAPGQTQAGADSTFLICQAMMGGPGSTASNNFYFAGNNVTQPGGGGGFAWVLQEGNPNLKSESSDTWTFGAVIRSPWDNPWLSSLTATFDWYKVEIEDAILQYSLDYAAYRCFGTRIVSTPQEAAEQAASPGCQLLPRDQNNGAALSSKISYDNQATIKTSGIDIGLNWFSSFSDLGINAIPGSLGLNLTATVLDYYKTRQSPAPYDVEIDWAGSLGPNLTGTQGGAYDYRLFGSLTYMLNDWNVSLRWRHLPEVDSAGMANTRAIMRNNASVVASGEGMLLSYSPITERPTPAYNIFDLAVNWNASETIQVRGGITNLFDIAPKTSSNPGRPFDVPLSSYCEGKVAGCQTPTSYSLPSRGGFNAGYYDTLGRRFFLGVKVSF
jgi:iron complex outermembrane receptor protein